MFKDQVSARSRSSSAAGCSTKGSWHQQMPFVRVRPAVLRIINSCGFDMVRPVRSSALHPNKSFQPTNGADAPADSHPANAKAAMVRFGPDERSGFTWPTQGWQGHSSIMRSSDSDLLLQHGALFQDLYGSMWTCQAMSSYVKLGSPRVKMGQRRHLHR